jgi:hypothetical protein
MKETSMVLAPFHAPSCPEILKRTVQGVKSGFDNVVRARHIDRPIGIREAKGLFWAQRPFILLRVKLHISAGALITEPLANVPLVRARLLCQVRGCHGALGKLLV